MIRPDPSEAEAFLDGVDALRERGERLEARLARLEARLKGTHAQGAGA